MPSFQRYRLLRGIMAKSSSASLLLACRFKRQNRRRLRWYLFERLCLHVSTASIIKPRLVSRPLYRMAVTGEKHLSVGS